MARFPSQFTPQGGGFGPQGGGGGGSRAMDYAAPTSDASVVARFFNTVYAWMASGLALTALVALYVGSDIERVRWMIESKMVWVILVVQIILAMVIGAAVRRISAPVATILFMIYAALMGAWLSPIFIVYTKSSIATTFFVTAGMFGAMSVYGMVTRRDLTQLGSLLFMALIGLVLASVVNIFLGSPALYWVITYAGVVIFVGLTAYDTQKLKEVAYATAGEPALAARLAISGALMLYLDFVNLFILLLRILGARSND